MRFEHRRAAGKLLAKALGSYASEPGLLVLALPRGGVPVAFEVATALKAPLDVFLVRKLGVPGHEELAMGAVSNSGMRVLNDDVISALGMSQDDIDRVTEREVAVIRRRESLYREGREPLTVEGRSIILVDDGLATGSTMLAAIRSLKAQNPVKIIVAVPVSPPSTLQQIRDEVDEVYCLMAPEPFHGVGLWYEDFSQTTDSQVVSLLAKERHLRSEPFKKDPQKVVRQNIRISCDNNVLQGVLSTCVAGKGGLVIFAHGSGSGRHSPRNTFVAERLHRAGHCTLLFDLLTEKEEEIDARTRHLRFDIPLLARRLEHVTSWVTRQPLTKNLQIGFFGASTGAAAALIAAATLGYDVKAVVSRGGRPDLAGNDLANVKAPTLLIVGGNDKDVIELNREAMNRMRPSLAQLKIVPGASHLFEEPGTLLTVADLAADWFSRHLSEETRTMSKHLRDDHGLSMQ